MKNLAYCGIFMLGAGLLICSGIELAEYINLKRNKIPAGRPAGTYEINMDEYF